MSKGQVSIAIVGAGIGGLAVASLLQRRGFEVRIYEQAKQFARIGAGIQVTPNAVKMLRYLGIEQALRKTAFEPEVGLAREWNTGDVTNTLDFTVMEGKYGTPYLCMHRADLHAALEGLVQPGTVQFDRKLAGVAQDRHGVTLTFVDGSEARADAVVSADGVHSVMRQLLFGKEQPRATGLVAYRSTVSAAALGDTPRPPARTKWWGPDRHIVTYFMTRERDELYFVATMPERADWVTPESWSAKGDPDELRAAYKGFHPEIYVALEACTQVHKWALLERDPFPRWSNGRVVILGDAAHPMTPFMSQGAASALEDSTVLARCLEGADRDGIERAFARYEAVRKPRTSQIQITSSQNTWMRRGTNPDWVYGYDASTVPLDEPAAA